VSSVTALWDYCKHSLQQELPAQQFVTWIQPLQLRQDMADTLCLVAPNRFIKSHVEKNFQSRIEVLANQYDAQTSLQVLLLDSQSANDASMQPAIEAVSSIGSRQTQSMHTANQTASKPALKAVSPSQFTQFEDPEPKLSENRFSGMQADTELEVIDAGIFGHSGPSDLSEHESLLLEQEQSDFESNVDPKLTFDSFVEGKSNQLARAAAIQVAENPGGSYNPLFLYGASGLGKTHLMHAVGNELLKRKPNAKVAYLHSERFVANMVKALQQNKINEFKRLYRGVDALLIDDIQFFAGKERSQEEFFHTFNALIEGGQQIILTCDRYPREIKGLEERLRTRFSWGLSVAVEPPELETRVAILMQKARQQNMEMSEDAAFFIARRLRSNVRELEGALKRVIAQAHFKNKPIDIELIKESLKDLLSMQDRLVSIDNIQKTVAEYYKIKVADLHSKRRNRSVARPRQVAMSLAKELTSHSLPEIGDAFGGRDHTTVLHACRKVEELKESNTDIAEDLKNLLRILTT